MRKSTSSRLSAFCYGPIVVAAFTGLAMTTIAAGASERIALPESAIGQAANMVVADAHDFRHCHNLSRRTYCHKKGRLPQNWPPNSNTPHRGGMDKKMPCRQGEPGCGPRRLYGQG